MSKSSSAQLALVEAPSTTSTLIGPKMPETMRIGEILIDQAQNMRIGGSKAEDVIKMRKSLVQDGQLQRIVIMPAYSAPEGSGFAWQVVLGYTRAQAVLDEYGPDGMIDVDIAAEVTPERARLLSALENLKRADQGPLSQGQMFLRIMETDKLTRAALGKRLGISPNVITNRVNLVVPRVMDDAALRAMLDDGKVSERAVLNVLGLADKYESKREKWLAALMAGTMNGADVEAKVAALALREQEAAEAASANQSDSAQEASAEAPAVSKRVTKKALNVRAMTQFMTELLPEQPEPVEGVEPVEPEWDFTANVAYMVLKAQAGKCSGKKFREQMEKLRETGAVDA